jgi:hypothetical protein
MKYAKPEVTLLGRAAAAIQLQAGKIPYSPPDNQPLSVKFTVSAYEADE